MPNHQVHVFTSSALNYLPKVRMLFESLRKHHPEWTLHLALADDLPADFDYSKEPLDTIISINELQIHEWKGWAFCHTITELSTAIKPFVLSHLLKLSGNNGIVLYMDPDTAAFSRLDDITAALEESSILLTPHQTRPEQTLAAIIDNEICSLKHGIYNLGFIGVSNTDIGNRFAEWWSRRLYYFCRDDIPNGLFTDQRWIDLVPAFFQEVAIMKSSRHNLATWNITTRVLEKDVNQTILVDGEPLGFYHFTGFDSGAHRIMAAKNSENNPVMAELIRWYSDKIQPTENDPLTHQPWAFAMFSDGEVISKEQRVVYRMRRDLQKSYPDPFLADGYKKWWHNRAKKEYPDLFISKNKASMLRELQTPITPGFVLNDPSALLPTSLVHLAKQAIRDPRTGVELSRRAWQILRNEGIPGVRSRLS